MTFFLFLYIKYPGRVVCGAAVFCSIKTFYLIFILHAQTDYLLND